MSLSSRFRFVLACMIAAPAIAFAAGVRGPSPHGFRGHQGPPTVEQALSHAHQASEFAFWKLDATPAQQDKLSAKIDVVVPQVHAAHGEAHELRRAAADILASDTVDEVALEALRQDAVDLFDRTTAALLDQVVDVARILTPEQRADLRELRSARDGGPAGARPSEVR